MPQKFHSWDYTQETETYSKRNLETNIHSHLIYERHKEEITHLLIHEWINLSMNVLVHMC
jgi:hypothetical protein